MNKSPWVEKEFSREVAHDPGFQSRMFIMVLVPSFVGMVITIICFVLLALFRDNALCQ